LNGIPYDGIGASVAVSADGTTLAAGAPDNSSDGVGLDAGAMNSNRTGSGGVYVFTHGATGWTQQIFMKASNPDVNDQFGSTVALSGDGNTLAVASWAESSNATGIDGDQTDNSAPASGAVYVFVRVAGSWSQQAYVKASNTRHGADFGVGLALSANGDTLVVGALGDASGASGVNADQTDMSASGAGAAYVFARAAGVWTQQAYLKAANARAGALFGSSVSASGDGNLVAIGAPAESSSTRGVNAMPTDGGAGYSGAVYLFSRAMAAWTQSRFIKASNADADDQFGYAVSLSSDGTTLAVGATGEASLSESDPMSNFFPGTGAVYVFAKTMSSWAEQAYLKSSDPVQNERFGYCVALSGPGDVLAGGAYQTMGTGGTVFVRGSGVWVHNSFFTPVGFSTFTDFGRAVAMSADAGVIAFGDDAWTGGGRVWLYEP
jgi:hypothetical protein